MSRIHVLSETVKNQIAAGEVIERPASVVKELVENALDAGARSISVTVESGGLKVIRVADDGCGIPADEVDLAFARHATSKLTSADDLWHLDTLGFRGEALPSIASVARVELLSRESAAVSGVRKVVDGGSELPAEPWGAAPGTVVTVRDLFYNTPARLKYLKAAQVEATHVAALVTSLAVAHPEVAFRLVSEGRELLATAGDGELRSAVLSALGSGVGRNLRLVKEASTFGSVAGYVGAPEASRANRSLEIFSLNGRLIAAKTLSVAVEKAFGNLLPLRRYPFCVLEVNVPPNQVDVNVHPAKREVRFKYEREIFGLVYRAVRSTLERENPLAGAGASPPSAEVSQETTGPSQWPAAPLGQQVREACSGWQAGAETPLALSGHAVAAAANWDSALARASVGTEPGGNGVAEPGLASNFIYHGQAARSYLLVETGDGVALVDQHAAHERLLYDLLRQSLERGAALPAQAALLPQSLELPPAEASLLEAALDPLATLGFVLEPFGVRTFLIRAVPVALARLNLQQLVADAVGEEQIEPRGGALGLEALDRLLRTMACKAAVKAGQALDRAEAEALLSAWLATDSPWTCPHGRPVAVRLGFNELAHRFLRT